jgi:mRNA interferase RelE/StbE
VKVLGWTVEFSPKAEKQLRKLDRPVAQSLYDYLKEIETLDNPRSRGKALTGKLKGLWRYRVLGEWRIVCDIIDQKMVVLAIDIDKRKDVYRR